MMKLKNIHILLRLIGLCLAGMLVAFVSVGIAGIDQHGYPRVIAVNIGNPTDYENTQYRVEMSRADVLILNFWPQWKEYKFGKNGMANVVRDIKQRNPDILIGQYTILTETQPVERREATNFDKSEKLTREGWWLRDINGERVQWTDKYSAYETNISQWTKPDENGLRYPEWLARRDYNTYFRPELGFDIWYFDNALSKPAVKIADWNRDGKNDASDDLEIVKAHREGHVAEWRQAHELRPDMSLMGNSDDLSSEEFSGKLHGAFLEALIGKSWSMERWKGWEKMMLRYHSAITHTDRPHIVGFNVWGRGDDYQQMRYGLASCLLDDGYFSYTDLKAGYSSVPWFDEFDVELGSPLDPSQVEPWEKGVYRRRFEHGLALVNPGFLPKTVMIDPGYRRIKGKQAPDVNDGAAVTSITLRAKDGIILVRE